MDSGPYIYEDVQIFRDSCDDERKRQREIIQERNRLEGHRKIIAIGIKCAKCGLEQTCCCPERFQGAEWKKECQEYSKWWEKTFGEPRRTRR